jgi:hypothetical protein
MPKAPSISTVSGTLPRGRSIRAATALRTVRHAPSRSGRVHRLYFRHWRYGRGSCAWHTTWQDRSTRSRPSAPAVTSQQGRPFLPRGTMFKRPERWQLSQTAAHRVTCASGVARETVPIEFQVECYSCNRRFYSYDNTLPVTGVLCESSVHRGSMVRDYRYVTHYSNFASGRQPIAATRVGRRPSCSSVIASTWGEFCPLCTLVPIPKVSGARTKTSRERQNILEFQTH